MSDTFANPQPPSNYKHAPSKDDSGPMTNDDFRKLLMTPSAGSVRAHKLNLNSVRSSNVNNLQKKKVSNEATEKRKERKLFYAALVNESKEKQAELAQKYRDRAKERREKEKTGDVVDDVTAVSSTNYRAVAPGFNLANNAERRRQLIEESKYLGGDLEHTHLVKGLDYALLQKIKSQEEDGADNDDEEGGGGSHPKGSSRRKDSDDEDDNENEHADKEDNEDGDDEEGKLGSESNEKYSSVDEVLESAEQRIKMNLKPKLPSKTSTAALAAAMNRSLTENNPFAFKKALEAAKLHKSSVVTSAIKKKPIGEIELDDENESLESKISFKTVMARNLYRQLFEIKPPKTNELFQPNRMAYIVDLNDEETDVPITSIRSKADCPNNENNSVMTTNDIVINKLTQILSYLRHGKRDAKKLKKKGVKVDEVEGKKVIDAAHSSLGIYDDIGDYIPELTKAEKAKKAENELKKRNYFGEKDEREEPSFQAPSKEVASEFIRNVNQKYANKEIEGEKAKKDEKKSGFTLKFDTDSYSECYPGTKAEEDVNIDSDEEVDFTKMDLGNKKGPVNRWDFDTNEEYSDYMSNREALPKAAFQYGLKMTDGRKTKRMVPDSKTEKAKIDKEWSQISRLIDKRKNGEYSNSDIKKIKY